MSADTILTFLEDCSAEEKTGFQVATQCAPVLKGIKIANLVTMRPGAWHQVIQNLHGCRVICVPLYADAQKEVLFLYRYEMLERHLRQENVACFLRNCGYRELTVRAVLTGLRRRYQQYAGAKQEFPHELGVLLGYPVEDVKGFIHHGGKNSLLAKYWKVYQNKEKAEQLFGLYDEAREQAMEEIIKGYPLAKVAAP